MLHEKGGHLVLFAAYKELNVVCFKMNLEVVYNLARFHRQDVIKKL
jgi:hypothetical protein